MATARTSHVCSDCGTHHPKWLGQCSGCGAYGTLTEEALSSGLPTEAHPGSPRPVSSDARPPVAIADVVTAAEAACATGIAEFDRTLSGGLVPGSVTLLGGEPGIGKSTLALQIAGTWPGTVLYVSAEESAQQVRRRAERLGVVRDGLFLLAETGLGDIDAAVSQIGPSLMVIDSVQTVADPAVSSAPGSVSQVRAVAQHLTHIAKRHDLPTVLIGHVTKDGDLAGPRALEHLVDTVLTFEGDRHHALRMVRAVKHRYGSTNELSLFEMTGDGLRGVADPSALFLADRRPGTPGSAVVPTLEGRRPLVLEVQALTTAAPDNVPARRTTQHIDHNRLSLLLAVMERHAGLPVRRHDVYASTVGGVRVSEPGMDLAVCVAVASALADRPLSTDIAVVGEVGLGGEIRQVGHTERRFAEAARLGFTAVIAPERSPEPPAGLTVWRAGDIREALRLAGVSVPSGNSHTDDSF